jgi:hypothetical protein
MQSHLIGRSPALLHASFLPKQRRIAGKSPVALDLALRQIVEGAHEDPADPVLTAAFPNGGS